MKLHKKSITSILTLCAVGISATASHGAFLITQYYEGLSNNKYIELTNISSSTIDFSVTNYTIANYNNANRENWKTGGASTASNLLDSGTVASGASLIIRNSSAAAPDYAASLGITSGTINFNGDDSWAIFLGVSTAFADLVDVFGVTGSGFADTSYTRNTATTTTSDFNASDWTQHTLEDVANAGVSDEARLGFSSVPEPTTALLGGLGMLALLRRRR